MDFTEFIDEIKDNPLVMAVGSVILIFIVWYFHSKSKGAGVVTPVSTDTSTIPPVTYNQSFNSYPVVNGNTVLPPVVKPPVVKPPVVKPPVVKKPPITPVARYITVKKWPDKDSTLSGIASTAHISLAKVEALNPQYRNNYNLIYAGQQVRVS